MNDYLKIQPEVIVGLGERTEFSEIVPPFKTITNLHIMLEDWLGDDLMECFPAYIVTDNLKNALVESSYSGFQFKTMEVTQAEYFDDNFQLDKELPIFHWMVISGNIGSEDMALNNKKELFIRSDFLEFLNNDFDLNYLIVNPEKNEFDDLLEQMLNGD